MKRMLMSKRTGAMKREARTRLSTKKHLIRKRTESISTPNSSKPSQRLGQVQCQIKHPTKPLLINIKLQNLSTALLRYGMRRKAARKKQRSLHQ